jgi:hypothetical protein
MVVKKGNKYIVVGGTIPPFTMELLGKRYVMPGWHLLGPDEPTPNIEDIGYIPYKPKPIQTNLVQGKKYKVKSSRGDSYYEVVLVGNSITCTCPGYSFRKKCRHIEETKKIAR